MKKKIEICFFKLRCSFLLLRLSIRMMRDVIFLNKRKRVSHKIVLLEDFFFKEFMTPKRELICSKELLEAVLSPSPLLIRKEGQISMNNNAHNELPSMQVEDNPLKNIKGSIREINLPLTQKK